MKKLILLAGLLFLPLFASASIDHNLYYGLRSNDDVREMQEFFIDNGDLANTPVTGNFLSLTLKAVKHYQASKNIIQTGYVGTLTRAAIHADLDLALIGSNEEANQETGSTPPAAVPQNTTNDVVTQLQAQNALLQQQINSLNKVVENTTPTPKPDPLRGCTDKTMANYNHLATVDNGSCRAWVYGCTNLQANNYNPLAEQDNRACTFTPRLTVSFTPASTSSYSVSSGILGDLTLKAELGAFDIASSNIQIQIGGVIGQSSGIPNKVSVYRGNTFIQDINCVQLQCSFAFSDNVSIPESVQYPYSIRADLNSLHTGTISLSATYNNQTTSITKQLGN